MNTNPISGVEGYEGKKNPAGCGTSMEREASALLKAKSSRGYGDFADQSQSGTRHQGRTEGEKRGSH